MTRFAAFPAVAAITGVAATVITPAHAGQASSQPVTTIGRASTTHGNPNVIKQTVCANNPAACGTTPTPTQGGSPTPDCATVLAGHCYDSSSKYPDEQSAFVSPNVKPTFSRLPQ